MQVVLDKWLSYGGRLSRFDCNYRKYPNLEHQTILKVALHNQDQKNYYLKSTH